MSGNNANCSNKAKFMSLTEQKVNANLLQLNTPYYEEIEKRWHLNKEEVMNYVALCGMKLV